MPEFSAVADQTVLPGESIVFTQTLLSNDFCSRFIRHRDETGSFLLSGFVPTRNYCCPCMQDNSAEYLVDFGANISIPTGGTVEEISVALTIDGTTVPASLMAVTPAAVEERFNVSRAITLPIWKGCCETVTVRNTSNQPITVSNANIIFARADR